MLCHFFYFGTGTFPFPSTGFIFYFSVLLGIFFFYLKFSILLLFSHPFLTFFSLSSLWNWFLTCAVVVQGPPGLPGLKGDPGSKGEKVGVGTYYCVRLHGGFISPNMKWADKQKYLHWKELWAVIFVQVRCANSSSEAHVRQLCNRLKADLDFGIQRIISGTIRLCKQTVKQNNFVPQLLREKTLAGVEYAAESDVSP